MTRPTKHIAANIIETPEGLIEPGAIELKNGYVSSWTNLDGEQAFTEWMTGKITVLLDATGKRQAYFKGQIIK